MSNGSPPRQCSLVEALRLRWPGLFVVIMAAVLFAAFVLTVPTAEAKDRATRKAESRVAREVRIEYDTPTLFTSARCSRLTKSRWTCRWRSDPSSFEEGADGLCYRRGKARATRFKFGWDVRLRAVREVYGCP